MSAPRCAICHDSGSKNQTGDYLDCPACDMPHTRKALNDFVKSLGPTHPEDVALAIHQRALAMAPKQEAPQPAPEIRTVLRDSLASGLTMAYGCSRVWSAWGVGTMSEDDFYPASECDELLDELCDLAIAALRPDLAAPAAANGAMPELPPYIYGREASPNEKVWTESAVRAILAAGPDASLVKALESALAIINNEADPDEYVAPLKVIRAALSGAKGN